MNERVGTMEVKVCDDLINRIEVTGAGIAHGQLFFVRGSILSHCETEGEHFEQLVRLCALHSVR
jgi:hypothetical protein